MKSQTEKAFPEIEQRLEANFVELFRSEVVSSYRLNKKQPPPMTRNERPKRELTEMRQRGKQQGKTSLKHEGEMSYLQKHQKIKQGRPVSEKSLREV